MLREHRDERQLEELERALTPPTGHRRPDGTPWWYEDDEAAWSQFRRVSAATK